MTEVRTRDEALAAIDAGLARWAGAATDVLAQAMAAAGGAQAAAEAEAVGRSRRVAELADLLASLGPEEKLRPVAAADLAAARESLAAARQAVTRLADVAARTAALQRSQAANTAGFVAAARGDLALRGGELGAYRGASDRTGGLAGPGAGSAVAPGPLSGTAGAAWLAGNGLSDLDVAQAAFADNPVTGAFGRGDVTRADYRWALSTWDETVRPGLEQGLTRDDFAARDAARGAPPLRRTADVYDMFLGSDPIRVERRRDGSVVVLNGRHRIQIAGELGITRLPAELVRLMAAALDPAVTALADAVRALERTLGETRAGWDDSARRAFDSRHALVVVGDAMQSLAELRRLATDVTAAIRLLDNSAHP